MQVSRSGYLPAVHPPPHILADDEAFHLTEKHTQSLTEDMLSWLSEHVSAPTSTDVYTGPSTLKAVREKIEQMLAKDHTGGAYGGVLHTLVSHMYTHIGAFTGSHQGEAQLRERVRMYEGESQGVSPHTYPHTNPQYIIPVIFSMFCK